MSHQWEKNGEGKYVKNEILSKCPNPRCPFTTDDGKPLPRLRHTPDQVARCKREFSQSMGDA